MIICAVDQSTSCSGYCCLDTNVHKLIDYGSFKESHKTEAYQRIHNMKVNIFDAFQKNKCEYFVLENVFMNRNPKGEMLLSSLRGVLIDECISNNIPYTILLSSQWRKILGIVGRKRVDQKKAAVEFVNKLYGLKLDVKSDDIAEAISIATAFERM